MLRSPETVSHQLSASAAEISSDCVYNQRQITQHIDTDTLDALTTAFLVMQQINAGLHRRQGHRYSLESNNLAASL